jgi:hypothetical protein
MQQQSTATTPVMHKEQYLVKMIKLGTRRCPIILQSQNGPCPLLGIVNALILRGATLAIDTNKKYVDSDYLVDVLGSYLLEYASTTANKHEQISETDINEALSILPLIKEGLNVNVKFIGCNSFEDIPEMRIFSLLKLKLVHGWLVDPQDTATSQALGDLTYNQAVERVFLMRDVIDAEQKVLLEQPQLVDLRSETYSSISEAIKHIHSPQDIVTKLSIEQRNTIKRDGQLISDFLESSSSQLTYYGLTALHEFLPDNKLGILFRNNHFATICKYNGHVHLLCTDEGFVDQEDIVWERMDEIGGDNIYCRGDFSTFQSRHTHEEVMNSIIMHQEQRKEEQNHITDSDHQLALRLQQEENRAAQRNNQQQRQTQPSPRTQQPQEQHTVVDLPPPTVTVEPSGPTLVPFGEVPTIRQQKEARQPSPSQSKKNDKYGNQASQLAQLNAERREREQQQKTSDPAAFDRAKNDRYRSDKNSRAKGKDDKCCIQ